MKILCQDLWSVKAPVLCITTNGYVKQPKQPNQLPAAVMGRGCALEAMQRLVGIEYELGSALVDNGNHVQVIYKTGTQTILAFPVKHVWWQKADLTLIDQSCRELKEFLAMHNRRHARVVIPRPGCGNGQLNWYKDVRPILHQHFWNDRNILVVHKQETLDSKHTSET